jgi:hypothetical protein
MESEPGILNGSGAIATRWVFLTTLSFWTALLLRDTFERLWNRVTGVDLIGSVTSYGKLSGKYWDSKLC